jgi:hypothetical protein
MSAPTVNDALTPDRLERLYLSSGKHANRERGVCLLEAAAWFAGEEHTDHPACVSPYLAALGRSVTDVMTPDERQYLRPFVPRLVGTRAPLTGELERRRRWHAADVAVRRVLPRAMEGLGLVEYSTGLRELPVIHWDGVLSVRYARELVALAHARCEDEHFTPGPRPAAAAAGPLVTGAGWAAGSSSAALACSAALDALRRLIEADTAAGWPAPHQESDPMLESLVEDAAYGVAETWWRVRATLAYLQVPNGPAACHAAALALLHSLLDLT